MRPCVETASLFSSESCVDVQESRARTRVQPNAVESQMWDERCASLGDVTRWARETKLVHLT